MHSRQLHDAWLLTSQRQIGGNWVQTCLLGWCNPCDGCALCRRVTW